MIYHAEAQTAVRVVVQHNAFWSDAGLAAKVRDRLRRFFQRQGLPTAQAYLHVMGDDPTEGVRFHVDALFSGPERRDFDVDELRQDVADVTSNHLPGGERCWYGTYVRVEAPGVDGWLGRLYNHGKYSGRPTLNTAAIYAGRSDTAGRGPYYLTNVGAKDCPEDPYDYLVRGGHAVVLGRTALIEAQVQHREARRSMPRALLPRGHTVNEATLDAVLRASYWRRTWRLEREDELRERFT